MKSARRFWSGTVAATCSAAMVAGTIGVVGAGSAGAAATSAVAAAEPVTQQVSERRAAPRRVVDLVPGRGDARVEITRNGRFAIVHQGSSYAPETLLKVNLTTSRVVGRGPLPADADSKLAVAGNRFAYTTRGKDLFVTDISKAKPRRVRKVGFRVRGQRADLFDVAVTPNGKFAYLTARDWIHTPGTHLLVLRIRKNGVPKLVRRVPVEATHLAVSRNGKRLAAAAGRRIHAFNLQRPGRPRRLGAATRVVGDVHSVAFGAGPQVVFAGTVGGAYAINRVHLGRKKVMRRAVLLSNAPYVFGGVAVNANGKRVVVTSGYADESDRSVWLLNGNLRTLRTMTGPCYPDSAASSLRGPTKNRLYVADSGICGQARLWQVAP